MDIDVLMALSIIPLVMSSYSLILAIRKWQKNREHQTEIRVNIEGASKEEYEKLDVTIKKLLQEMKNKRVNK